MVQLPRVPGMKDLLAAAKEKDLERRKALGLDTPLRPIPEAEKKQKPDAGTPVTVPASLSVH